MRARARAPHAIILSFDGARGAIRRDARGDLTRNGPRLESSRRGRLRRVERVEGIELLSLKR